MLNDKTILITGGTGSFGKRMVRYIVEHYKPLKLIVFSRDELKQFEMSQIWSQQEYPFLRYILGDVRDKESLSRSFHGVDYVIHAAALKQVPAAEYNPAEFIKTNILGAMNVIDVAIHNNVSRIVALSTDKACNPVNLYGATKLCSDKLFVAARAYTGFRNTKFAVVRYGNVLGSRGSVIPFFKEMAKTGLLPITDERMTRFWITLDDAVRFVLSSLARMEGGEIFVPQIPSMRIVDLARAIAPHCRHEIIGIRPGEKIHETLISEEEARHAIEFSDHFVIQSNLVAFDELLKASNGTAKLCEKGFKYTSDGNSHWLGVEELRLLIQGEYVPGKDGVIQQSHWDAQTLPQ